jgi:hypothetical protein
MPENPAGERTPPATIQINGVGSKLELLMKTTKAAASRGLVLF